MATTNDLRVGGTLSLDNLAAGQQYVLSNTLDCATTNLANTDIAQLFNIPAGTFVERVQVLMQTIEDSAGTFDIGDTSGAADDYIDGADATTAAGTLLNGDASVGTTMATIYAKYYSAADVISLTAAAALDTMKVKVFVYCKKLL